MWLNLFRLIDTTFSRFSNRFNECVCEPVNVRRAFANSDVGIGRTVNQKNENVRASVSPFLSEGVEVEVG